MFFYDFSNCRLRVCMYVRPKLTFVSFFMFFFLTFPLTIAEDYKSWCRVLLMPQGLVRQMYPVQRYSRLLFLQQKSQRCYLHLWCCFWRKRSPCKWVFINMNNMKMAENGEARNMNFYSINEVKMVKQQTQGKS